jgi:hypothetical protein
MEKGGSFADFDDETIYTWSQLHALKGSTRNFVVEFGKDSAHIAFDLGSGDVRDLCNASRQEARPVRWMQGVVPSSIKLLR